MRQKYILIFLLAFGLILSFPKPLFAHPGATASDGCHYCRTNCDKWGVPWNERHCHGGGGGSSSGGSSGTTSRNSLGTSTALPTKSPTLKPTVIPLNLEENKEYKVVSVVDRDTIKVLVGNRWATVRLLGIDSPEMTDKRRLVRCFAQKAKVELSGLILNKKVTLERDFTQGNKDIYGRFLRYVYLDGDLTNSLMVKNGFAYAYRKYPVSKLDEFIKLEQEAKERSMGLWGNLCR